MENLANGVGVSEIHDFLARSAGVRRGKTPMGAIYECWSEIMGHKIVC